MEEDKKSFMEKNEERPVCTSSHRPYLGTQGEKKGSGGMQLTADGQKQTDTVGGKSRRLGVRTGNLKQLT